MQACLEILKLAQKAESGRQIPFLSFTMPRQELSSSAPSCWFFFVAFHWSGHLSIWFCIQCIHNPKSWPCRVTMDVTGQWHGYPTHSHFKKGLTWPSWPCLSKTCVRKRAGCLCGHPWNLSIHPLFGKDIQEDSLWRTGRLKETSSHNT